MTRALVLVAGAAGGASRGSGGVCGVVVACLVPCGSKVIPGNELQLGSCVPTSNLHTEPDCLQRRPFFNLGFYFNF